MKKKLQHLNFNVIGENISKLMEECGIDATQLAKQTGLPCSTISRLRSKMIDFSPNLSSLIPIANFFKVSLSQLIGEEPLTMANYGQFKPHHIQQHRIPLLRAEKFLDYFSVEKKHDSAEMYIDVDILVSQQAFAYFVHGNAMEPQFSNDTLLVIEPLISPENLDHILLIPNGKKIPIFRQLLIDGEERYIRTLNPTFNEFIKISHNSHKILGVMIQSRRNFKYVESTQMNLNSKKVYAL